MVTLPLYFKHHKKAVALVSCLLLVLTVGSTINYYSGISGISINQKMHMGITVKIDGKTVYNNPDDLIFSTFYDYNMCKLFNDTTGCSNTTVNFYGTFVTANGCHTYNTAGVVDKPNGFRASTRCSASAAFLSTDTDTPISTVPQLATFMTTNGFAPVNSVTTHAGTSNTITLTATWTASASTSGIDKAAIGLWNDKNNAYVNSVLSGGGGLYVLTADIFAPQTVNSGQSFQVIWTISF